MNNFQTRFVVIEHAQAQSYLDCVASVDAALFGALASYPDEITEHVLNDLVCRGLDGLLRDLEFHQQQRREQATIAVAGE